MIITQIILIGFVAGMCFGLFYLGFFYLLDKSIKRKKIRLAKNIMCKECYEKYIDVNGLKED